MSYRLIDGKNEKETIIIICRETRYEYRQIRLISVSVSAIPKESKASFDDDHTGNGTGRNGNTELMSIGGQENPSERKRENYRSV